MPIDTTWITALAAFPTDNIVITALTGGLAGALLTLFGQALCRWWNRPLLEIVFGNETRGCVVPVEGWIADKETGVPIKNSNGNLRRGKMKYLRLKVENRGKTFAKNVSLCVTQITYKAAGRGESRFEEEVFELSLAPTAGNPYVFNLAAQGHRFMDLVHTSLDDQNNLELVFDFGKGAHRLAGLNMGSGDYDAKVFASAENARSIVRNVHWSYGNTLDSLTIEQPK
jgi:hypothetical protein